MFINPIVRPPGPGMQVQELAGAGARPEDGTGSASLFAAIFALMMGQQVAVPVPADAPQPVGGEAAAGTPVAPAAFGAPATGQVPVPGDLPPSMPLLLNPAAAPLQARLVLQMQAQMQAQVQVPAQVQAQVPVPVQVPVQVQGQVQVQAQVQAQMQAQMQAQAQVQAQMQAQVQAQMQPPVEVEAVPQPQAGIAGEMVLPVEAGPSLPPSAQAVAGTAPQMPGLLDPVLSAPPIAPAAWRPVTPQQVVAQLQTGAEPPEVSPAEPTADEQEPSTLDDALMSLGLELLRRDAVPITPKTTSPAPVVADAATYTPDQLMEQVAGRARESQDGSYTLTLRLHPEHLGEVRLELRLSGREVQTVFQVASPEARQALESRFDQLRQNLTQSGLQLSGFDVQTGSGDRRHWEQERAEQFAPGRRQQEQPAAAKSADLLRIRRFTTVRGAGGLDTIA
jgi:flagellar hook-length control protein FliK